MRRIFILIVAFFQSCASIVATEDYVYRIETDPPGVPYTITDRGGLNVTSGTTPDSVTLPSGQRFFRKQDYTIKIGEIDNSQVEINSPYTIEDWYAGNLIFGWLVGFLIVDPATGAMYKPVRQVIDTSFTEKAVNAATITISDDGGRPLTAEEKRKIKESDDMYLGHD